MQPIQYVPRELKAGESTEPTKCGCVHFRPLLLSRLCRVVILLVGLVCIRTVVLVGRAFSQEIEKTPAKVERVESLIRVFHPFHSEELEFRTKRTDLPIDLSYMEHLPHDYAIAGIRYVEKAISLLDGNGDSWNSTL